MEIQHDVKVFALDDRLEQNIQSMNAEGWLMLPGVAPVAIYHVVRMKGAVPQDDDTPRGVAKIAIDDSKVHIYRDGKAVAGQ